MNDKMLKRLAGVLAFLLVLWFVTKPRHTGVNLDEFVQTVIFGVSKNDVKIVEVYKETGEENPVRMQFVMQDDQWRLATYHNAKAQKSKMDRLIQDALEMTGKVRSEDPDQHPMFEITDEAGVHLLLKDETDKTLANLILGKKADDTGSGFVRFAGQDKVYFTDKNLLSALSIYGTADTLRTFNQKSFVDRQAVNQNKDELDLVVLSRGNRKMTLRKVEREVEVEKDSVTTTEVRKEWMLDKNGSQIALDQAEVDKFFRDAAKIHATEVVDHIGQTLGDMNKSGRYGFRRNSPSVAFQAEGQQPVSAIFGNTYGDNEGYYLITDDDAVIYKVIKTNFDKIFKWMDDLPKKTQ